MKAINLKSIRVRLTLGNIVVFGSILLLYAIGTSYFFVSTLSRQLDHSLKEELELVAQVLPHHPSGKYDLQEHKGEAARLERFLEVWTEDGQLLYRSETLGERSAGGPPKKEELTGGIRIQAFELSDGTKFRVGSTLDSHRNYRRFIRLAVSEDEYFQDLNRFGYLLLAAMPPTLLLISLSAYYMARRALRPTDKMVAVVRSIGAENLTHRLPVTNPGDELGRVALAFNELLSRVQLAFERLKQFTADASHELRTPLTAMRSVGEVGLQSRHTEAEYRELIGSMLEESTRLTRLVDSLLFLARADAGKLEVHREDINLSAFAHSNAGLIGVLAEEKNQHLSIGGRSDIVVVADASLVSHALLNILDNAIKFSPAGSEISIHIGSHGSRGYVDVKDSGAGIPEEDRERVFERFYRLSSECEKNGSGLGLAISKWAVVACGGSVEVVDSKSSGSIFRILLPLADSRNLKQT